MRLSYEVTDRRGDVIVAICTPLQGEEYAWQVEFWGPKGLRHVEPYMTIGPDTTPNLALQEFVTASDLTATIDP